MSAYTDSSKVFKSRYENFIGGKWVAPTDGQYTKNTSPINGQILCEVPVSSAADIEKALDSATKAKESWGNTSVAQRASILLKIADRIDENLEKIAHAETWDNGKPIRETLNADIPLAADHFRYFAGCIRAQDGTISDLDHDTVAYPRAARRCGTDYPLEFPTSYGSMENRPGFGCRKHDCDEARFGNPREHLGAA